MLCQCSSCALGYFPQYGRCTESGSNVATVQVRWWPMCACSGIVAASPSRWAAVSRVVQMVDNGLTGSLLSALSALTALM